MLSLTWSVLSDCKPVQDFPILKQGKTTGCRFTGKFYKAGSIIQFNKCFNLRCSTTGNIFRNEKNCDESTPTVSPTSVLMTTKPPTTFPMTAIFGCQGDNGKIYVPGEKMSKGFDESSNWCYGSYCSENGQIIHWDNFNCKQTTQTTVPMTTSPPTTVPMTTSSPITVPLTTTPPTTFPMTAIFGCQGDNGEIYAPGEKMSEGFDESSNWCYGSYCSENGQIIHWDNFNCKQTTQTTVPMTTSPPTTVPMTTSSPITVPLTTTPPTTFPMTAMFGCQGDNGEIYAPGEKMSEGFDESSNWCYGSYCSENGQLTHWDNFNCKQTTQTAVPMTTSPLPPTTVPMTFDDNITTNNTPHGNNNTDI